MLQPLHNQRCAALLAHCAVHCYLTPLCQGVHLELYSSLAVQPEYEESSPTEEELLELQEQNFRLMQQQQQLEMEAAAQQELAAQAQPVGLRERIGFVGAGQARGTGARPTHSSPEPRLVYVHLRWRRDLQGTFCLPRNNGMK